MKVWLCSLAVLVATLVTASPAARAVTLVFDEDTFPTNPINGFGAFNFGDFGAAGAVTDGATSLIFDVVDSDASNGVFGGLGVDFLIDDGFGNFVPQDFVASDHQWEVRLKLLPDNAATSLRLTAVDDDGAGTGDEHVYAIDLTSVPNDGQFHTVTLPFDSPLFTQGAFGFTPGNGVVDPGLRQLQFQSEFGSAGRLNVEVDFARITPIIPEPMSLSLLALGCLAIGVSARGRTR